MRVLEPGMLSTVQDLGRPGLGAIGVPNGGAADSVALRLGNRIVGNPDDAAGIEYSLVGGSVEFDDDCVVVVAGATARATIERSGQSSMLDNWAALFARRGDRLHVGPVTSGARAYLCVSGGITVPSVLGSRSTYLGAGFGGHEGREIQKGDILTQTRLAPNRGFRANVSDPTATEATSLATRARHLWQNASLRTTLRCVDGAHHESFGDGFWGQRFRVSSRSDRVGVRLEGSVEPTHDPGKMRSEGMMTGAVQIPPGGAPIVLGVDAPTCGGYPVIACVIGADASAIGQLRPGAEVAFERVSIHEARRLHSELQARIDREVPPA